MEVGILETALTVAINIFSLIAKLVCTMLNMWIALKV